MSIKGKCYGMFHTDYCESEVASGFKFMSDLKALFLVKVFMDTREKQQKISIGLFKPITKDQCQSILQHEVHLWNKVGHWKKYTLHNEKMSSWLTQEIQSNIIHKLENQARFK